MNWFGFGKKDSFSSELVTELRALRESIEADPVEMPDSDSTPLQLLERLDSLENRFEELRGMCLRQLQSASQRLKLAERKEESFEDEPTPTVQPAQFPAREMAQPDPTSDLEWAAAQIRARGEQPIL
jgi:hypothetical protein